jgi:hypothetical protein
VAVAHEEARPAHRLPRSLTSSPKLASQATRHVPP